MPVEHHVEPLTVVVLDEMAKLMEDGIVDSVTRCPDERLVAVDGARGGASCFNVRLDLLS